MGLKASEVQRLNSPQMSFFPEAPPENKLRVRHCSYSRSAEELGIRFHPNMRVPEASIVTLGFHDEREEPKEGTEALDAWETSSGGPIGDGEIPLRGNEDRRRRGLGDCSLRVGVREPTVHSANGAGHPDAQVF